MLGAICALMLLAACEGTRVVDAAPENTHLLAKIPGFPGVRTWGDTTAADVEDGVGELIDQIRAEARRTGQLPNGGKFDALVLSGGGSDGPYGAGLLVGWTEAGTRPDFSFVTGISAGAMIAPFAFLGPEFDYKLREFSLENSTDTLVAFQILRGIFTGFGLLDISPLEKLLAELITPEVVARIGAEHNKGRRLWIGTTNLDAQRPVYWDIGRIAASGREDAPALIRKIILASASIPGAFPPVFFNVDIGGRIYSEMHVDGGVTHQLFFYPYEVDLPKLPPDARAMVERGTIYVIRNTKLDPAFVPVSPGIVDIAGRAMSTLIKFGGQSDVRLLETQARRDGFGLKVTSVPEDFAMVERELFDPAYMRALFELGHGMAAQEATWRLEVAPASAPVTN